MSTGDAPGASRSSTSGEPSPSASAVSRARSSGLETTAVAAKPSSRRRAPTARACSRPSGVSGRSSSGFPDAASAWRTISSRIAAQDRGGGGFHAPPPLQVEELLLRWPRKGDRGRSYGLAARSTREGEPRNRRLEADRWRDRKR